MCLATFIMTGREGGGDCWKPDGAVNFTHLGCRQMGPINKIFKDVLDEIQRGL